MLTPECVASAPKSNRFTPISDESLVTHTPCFIELLLYYFNLTVSFMYLSNESSVFIQFDIIFSFSLLIFAPLPDSYSPFCLTQLGQSTFFHNNFSDCFLFVTFSLSKKMSQDGKPTTAKLSIRLLSSSSFNSTGYLPRV